MLDPRLEQFLESLLFQTFGETPNSVSIHFVGGGCINNTLRLESNLGTHFVKWNEDEENDMFQKEMSGLALLKTCDQVKVPQTINEGRIEGRNFLIMEFIEKEPPASDFWEQLGHGLASLHRISNESNGLDENNYIGRLAQKNTPTKSWIDFFIDNRLEVQLGLALYNNLVSQSFANKFRLLFAQLPGLLVDYPPSILHGDLWSGNFMVGPAGKPYLIDPAVYFGNREIELAFTQLFGGFDQRFYSAYNEQFELEPGFSQRADLYNLYPLMVHVNLFGKSYLSGVERTLNRYV